MVSRRQLQLALRAPLIDYCDGLPITVARMWEGKRFSRDAGVVTVSDALSPATTSLAGHSQLRGMLTLDGLYVIQWFALPNTGLELADTADEIVALYPPGTSFVTADGNAVQVKAIPAPTAGQVRPVNGAPVVTITVAYECLTLSEPLAA